MISANVVAYAETETLDRCLRNIKDYVDEIIILADQNHQETVEISKQYATLLIVKDLSGTIGDEWRNLLIEHSYGEWILVIDPDEVFEPGILTNLRELVKLDYDGVAFPRINHLRDEFGNIVYYNYYPDYQVRLFRNHGRYSGKVHYGVGNLSRIGYFNKGHILHDRRDMTMEDLFRKIKLYRDSVIRFGMTGGYKMKLKTRMRKIWRKLRMERTWIENPLKIYRKLVLRRWHISIPNLMDYVTDQRGTDMLERFRIRLWHNNDYVTFKPGISILVVTNRRLEDGTIQVVSEERVAVTKKLTIRNEEGTPQHLGDWNITIYSLGYFFNNPNII